MKTRRITSMTGSMLTYLMAALILLPTTACEEEPPISHEDFTKPDAFHSGYITTYNFRLHPDGGTVNLFDGAMEIVIPQGTVSKSTEFTMATLPVHYLDLDGYNMYNRAFYFEGDSPEQIFPNGITFKIRYDMVEGSWLEDLPTKERDLQIYWGSPTLYFDKTVVPVGECCVDCNCKKVIACVGKCGFYMVGEK